MHERIFQWPEVLQEMLEKRRGGWSYPALAREFRCDVSTVYAQCKKHGEIGRIALRVTLQRVPLVPRNRYIDFDGQIMVRSKTYKEYRYDQKQRDRQRFNQRIRDKLQKQREEKALQ